MLLLRFGGAIMTINSKESVDVFNRMYFRSFRARNLIAWSFTYTILMFFFFDTALFTINSLSVPLIGILIYFFMPDNLYKENQKLIDEFYKRTQDSCDNNKETISIVCNLVKFDGPTFGILKITPKKLSFTPLRENIQDQAFDFNEQEIKQLDVTITNSRRLIFNRMCFKQLSKLLRISCKQKKMFLQAPEIESTLKTIKEYLDNVK